MLRSWGKLRCVRFWYPFKKIKTVIFLLCIGLIYWVLIFVLELKYLSLKVNLCIIHLNKHLLKGTLVILDK
jgi:hypothetical protein